MFAYRSSPSRINNLSPYEMIFGEEPCTPMTASLAQAPVMATPHDILETQTTEYAKTLYKRIATAWSIAQEAERAYRASASPTSEGGEAVMSDRISTYFQIGKQLRPTSGTYNHTRNET